MRVCAFLVRVKKKPACEKVSFSVGNVRVTRFVCSVVLAGKCKETCVWKGFFAQLVTSQTVIHCSSQSNAAFTLGFYAAEETLRPHYPLGNKFLTSAFGAKSWKECCLPESKVLEPNLGFLCCPERESERLLASCMFV